MRTMQRGLFDRKAFRLGLLSASALVLSACSSDSDRLSFFGVDSEPRQITVVQPAAAVQYAQPQYQAAPQFQPAPQVQPVPVQQQWSQPQPIQPQLGQPQPVQPQFGQPVPYTPPTFTAPGYPQTTASIGQPTATARPTYQAMPQQVAQPVAQPVYRAPIQTQQVAMSPRMPVNAPNTHLAQTPAGMVGARAPQVTYQTPQVTYAAPRAQAAPITTASIGARAPQPLTPQPLAPSAITTGSLGPVQSAPTALPAPQMLPAALPSQSTRAPGWSAIGGTRVQVQQGETLYSMSRRYGIPVTELQRANNITDPSSVRMGQQIIIPVFSAGGVAAAPAVSQTTTGSIATPGVRRVPAPTPRPASLRTAVVQPTAPARTAPPFVAQAAPTAGTHVVASGETLYAIARRYNMSAQQLIAANGLANPNALRIGQRLVVSSSGQPLPQATQATQAAQLPSVAAAPTQTPAQVVAARSYTRPQPTQAQPVSVQQTAAIQQVAARSDEIAEQTPLQFRWPIRGRVLSTFGSGSDGIRNDGVNIAVPEGASIRAAEEGEVVYAGNELRGFGNLVLVQHRGGYVTAYAHNSRLDVQRGDRVQRGEVIARAGSTGDVETPQLHFEIRRGTTPVDPAPYLPAS